MPVTLDGTYKIIEGDPKYIITPSEVNVIIHPPIETAELTKDEIKQLPVRVRQIIVNAMSITGAENTEYENAYI